MRICLLLALSSFVLAVGTVGTTNGQTKVVRFDRDIRPILSNNCFPCHGPDDRTREGELRLDLKEHALADRDGEPALKAGDLEASVSWLRIVSDDPDELMPPPDSNKKLTPVQIDLIKRWIEQGVEWSDHWAFEPPRKPELPKVSNTKWLRNPIDHFVLARLDSEGLSPSAEADCRTLIRRLSFDLTGLPPSPEQVEAFVDDPSDTAYERLVDRLLASRHYGERMALMWLDAARYGDTSVFHADGPRDMWAWRDQVVRAYNQNMPFDQFTTEQLAGDLLPDSTIEQQVASGFNRNTGTTDEGGVIPEEYRVEYAVDRVKTTSTVWMGISMECGQCHEHKFDPISQTEYYRFYAFFNVSADGGMQTRNGNAKPLVEVPDPERQKKLPGVLAAVSAHEKVMAAHRDSIGPFVTAWVAKLEAEVKAAGDVALAPTDAIAHYTLDEGQGNTIADVVDSKRKGQVKGTSEWVEARFGQGLKLNGKTLVDLGDVGNFERTDKFSYGGWLYATPNTTGALVARMDSANAHRGYDILVQNNMVTAHIIHQWPGNAIKVKTKKKLKPEEWHHVLVTYDGSSKASGVKVYVDGESWEWDIEQDGLSETIRTPKSLLIGSRHGGGNLTATVDDVRIFSRELSGTEVQALAGSNPLLPILATPADQRSEEQIKTLHAHYLNNEDAKQKDLVKEQERLKAEEAELRKPLTTVMVMRDTKRDTFLLSRGAYNSPTEQKVQPGTPDMLPPMPKGAPRNRLGLARWLFQPDHPLTARVAVNRYWLMLFGMGIVATPEDFGSQGKFPSHPQLLDWLAVDFRESNWDVKRMVKQIVMSATYRQGTKVNAELIERDRGNLLLARGPRFRLQGEFIRDNALAISGLLNAKMGGPGVKPYQPPGLWAEVGLGGNPKFVQDHGDNLYRRSLYTYWKRSAPPPSMQIFDAPTREKCAIWRARTNTPLQALVTLNDVQFVEAARNLAQRMMLEGGNSPELRLAFAYESATARVPSESKQQVLLSVFNAAL
ncbi:MAG: DUF1553 domain-containing protein, partial [Pirellulaceae bacterium]|nr:DUF1553 domain-containing protein [Pirellulaceae bacterium]